MDNLERGITAVGDNGTAITFIKSQINTPAMAVSSKLFAIALSKAKWTTIQIGPRLIPFKIMLYLFRTRTAIQIPFYRHQLLPPNVPVLFLRMNV